jgi:hypothetical protein
VKRLFRRGRAGTPRWSEAAAVVQPFSRRCLFVIGAARSGTTMLQNAFNASPDVFLLGEPAFERDTGAPGFAARYHALQAENGNLPNKSTALPPVLPNDPPWWIWLRRLSEHHHRVGAKIALNPGDNADHAALLALFGQVFYDAAYIFIFREPLAAAVSLRRMGALPGRTQAAWPDLFGNILSAMRLYVRMAALFPNVTALLHEDINAGTFARLGAAAGCDLSMAGPYYNEAQVRAVTAEDVPAAARGHAHYATEAHRLLREVLAAENNLVQSNQNTENIDPGHRTAFGRLAMLLDPVLLQRVVEKVK